MNYCPESMFQDTFDSKKEGAATQLWRPLKKLGFFDRLDFVTQFLDRFTDIAS